MKKDLIILSICMFIPALSIYIYFKYLEKVYKKNYVQHDPLNKQIIDVPIISKNCCSWWPVSHFILFCIYSFRFRNFVEKIPDFRISDFPEFRNSEFGIQANSLPF